MSHMQGIINDSMMQAGNLQRTGQGMHWYNTIADSDSTVSSMILALLR